jgi:hypothetical protein
MDPNDPRRDQYGHLKRDPVPLIFMLVGIAGLIILHFCH